MKEKIKQFVNELRLNISTRMLLMAAGASGSAFGLMGVARADDPKEVIVRIADVLVKLFPPVGIILILFGGFKIVMAVRNDQPEAIKTAVMDVVVGVVLLVFDTFLWPEIRDAAGI